MDYDPRNVKLVVNGETVTGYAEDTFIRASKDEDNYSIHVGAQGEVTRSRIAHPVGTITVTLKSTSPFNAKFAKLAQSKEYFAAHITDGNTGATNVGGSKCFFLKPADREWGREESEREWTIKVLDYVPLESE